MAGASFNFLFEKSEDVDRQGLLQGDLLKRTPELAEAIGQAHSYYSTARDYSHFLVLTQSCDLVRRKGLCKSRYVTICAVRPLALAVKRELAKYTKPIDGCPVPTGDLDKSVLARQFLERVVHNTVDGMFFIPNGSAETVDEHLCAFISLSVALRVDHYDTLLSAKVGQVREIFQAKIGSLASNLYGKIGTPDIHDYNDTKTVDAYMKASFDDLGYASVAWLTPFQRRSFEAAVAAKRQASGVDVLTEAEAEQLLKTLPLETEAIADRVLEVLVSRQIVANDAEILRRAKNLLINDQQYRQLAKR